MNDALRAKVHRHLEHPEEPLMLTAVETAELDAYLALVSLFESEQKRKRSKKRKRKQSTSTRKTQEKNQ